MIEVVVVFFFEVEALNARCSCGYHKSDGYLDGFYIKHILYHVSLAIINPSIASNQKHHDSWDAVMFHRS
jgi:hypothetical protein